VCKDNEKKKGKGARIIFLKKHQGEKEKKQPRRKTKKVK